VAEGDYLRAEVEQHGPVCVLAIRGELDVFTVANLTRCVTAALKTRTEQFVLDLSGLTFIDCRGARALAAMAQAVPAGSPVVVRSVNPAVRRVLNLLELNLESRDMAGDDQATRLALQSQLLCALVQQAIAESHQLAETIAATEDRVADTMLRLAARRPQRADRLAALSMTARRQAAHFRSRAGHAPFSASPS